MKNRTFLFVTSFLTGTIISAQAGPFRSIEELDQLLPQVQQLKSIPSPRTFQIHPERTAAGVLHYAVDNKLGPVVLLGSRDDDKGYCNLGGLSEEKEGRKSKKNKAFSTLAETASREVEEESNGYYAHHPYELEQLPFVDILADREKGGSLLYRMYWKRVQKVDPKILLKTMEESEEDHSKEYTNFIWAPISTLLKSLKSNKPTVSFDHNDPSYNSIPTIGFKENTELPSSPQTQQTSFELYEPLFQALSTPSNLAFLDAIAERGDIPHGKRTEKGLKD